MKWVIIAAVGLLALPLGYLSFERSLDTIAAPIARTAPAATLVAIAQDTKPKTIKEETGPMPAAYEYIYVNLKKMEIKLYRDAVLVNKFDVLSIRAMGSKFDTPRGLFSIKTKEETHWSTIGEVWMPFAMQFSGDFFIHGWPHYDDGTPVPKGYSGGCIRLADDVAQEVYNFATIGMPVLVE